MGTPKKIQKIQPPLEKFSATNPNHISPAICIERIEEAGDS
jgi:hypothetical protein